MFSTFLSIGYFSKSVIGFSLSHILFISILMSQLKQSVEHLKSEINNLKVMRLLSLHPLIKLVPYVSYLLQPELSTTEVKTLEEEHKALLSDKDGELEYMQSLHSQLDNLKVHVNMLFLSLFFLFATP